MPNTIAEIIETGISFVTEDDNFYYIRPLLEEHAYDNTLWKVEKETRHIQYMDYTAYIIDIEDTTKSIDLKDFEDKIEGK